MNINLNRERARLRARRRRDAVLACMVTVLALLIAFSAILEAYQRTYGS